MASHSRCARALLILLALIATACGGTAATVTDTAGTSSDALSDEASADAAAGSAASTDDSAEDQKLAAPADAAVAANQRDMTQVLAFAIEASELESFTFTQGLAINIVGLGTPVAPAAPYAFGEVVNGETHVRVDLEAFVKESMGSLAGFGLGPTDLVGQEFEVWTTDSTLIMDLSKLDIVGADVQQFTSGPVSVTVADVEGVDVNAVVQQFGQGSQVTDPGSLFDALRSVTEAVDNGPATVGDVAVTSYTAKLTVGDYFESIGSGAGQQLSIVESLGLAEAEADAVATLVPALESLELDVNIMVDADGRVRRVSTSMNMTDLVVALFEGSAELSGEGQPQVDLGALFGPDGLQIQLNGWQEFHDYGAAPAISIPDSADITAQVNELFAD